MEQYISKSALLAEIERLVNNYDKALDYEAALEDVRDFLDSLEVKEVDLDSERRKYLTEHFNVYEDGILQSKRSNLPLDTYDVIKLAKHFFELGMLVNNHITAADRGKAEEIIVNLKRVEQDYHINLTKEIEWLRNRVKKED